MFTLEQTRKYISDLERRDKKISMKIKKKARRRTEASRRTNRP